MLVLAPVLGTIIVLAVFALIITNPAPANVILAVMVLVIPIAEKILIIALRTAARLVMMNVLIQAR